MNFKLQTVFSFIVLFTLTKAVAQDVVINEIMPSNHDFIFDEDGDASDWVELYNNSTVPVNLSGYFLSDKVNLLQLWQLPDTVIGSGDYIIVFASGKNRGVPGNELHSNFSIQQGSESVFLCNNNFIVHHIPAVNINSNLSYGFQTDGVGTLIEFHFPTPGTSNNNQDQLLFSQKGGVYDASFNLVIDHYNASSQIFYTLDGSLPTTASSLYTAPLYINQNLNSTSGFSQVPNSPPYDFILPDPGNVSKIVVIRAAAFDGTGNRVSGVETQSYFIKSLGIDHGSYPVISLCAEYNDLFDYNTGIFVPGVHYDLNDTLWTGNYYQGGIVWERNVCFEYYDPASGTAYQQNCGLRTYGGNSRRHMQKGMRLHARNDYGSRYFNFDFFDYEAVTNHRHLILKPFTASWSKAGMEDYISLKTAKTISLDAPLVKPVIVYLNGDYWGVYYLQERFNDWYLQEYYDIDRAEVDVIDNWLGLAGAGNNTNFLALMDFAENNTLADPSNYEFISDWIDIDNFINYQVFEIFISNYDWPANNMRCWRERKQGAKWKWVYLDGDASLQSLNYDSFEQALNTSNDIWPSNAQSTILFRKLLENMEFRNRFLSRAESLINGPLNYHQLKPLHQSIQQTLSSEIHNLINRFAFPDNETLWNSVVESCHDFLAERACVIKKLAVHHFQHELNITYCQPGETEISNTRLYPNPNNGYFHLGLTASGNFNAEVSVIDILGRVVYQDELFLISGDNHLDVQIPGLADGMYIANIKTGNNIHSTKFICKK